MSLIYCHRCTLPLANCVCQLAPKIVLPKPCTLLFHPREYSKRSNTGRLLKIATNVQSATWHRLKNHEQADQFKQHVLLYPPDISAMDNQDTSQTLPQDHSNIAGFIIIDATWQESRKMLRQSPWLAELPRMSLQPLSSQYSLRRNQQNQGMSTLETMSQWLFEQNQRNSAQELLNFLQNFQSVYLQAQQAGLLI